MTLPLWFRATVAAVIIAAVVGILGAIAYGIDQNGYQRAEARWKAKYADLEAKQAKANADAKAAALVKEREYQANLQGAQDAAKKREAAILTDANLARVESERVRGDLAAIRAKLPSLAEAAVRRYADAASVVFDQCQRRYTEVAEIADRCGSDLKTLEDAWPR
jgi:hypothetical protein